MTTAPLRILVVDDNADSARMLRVLLKCEGHEARIALDGPAAIEAAKLYQPDVVLLDLTLPGMSGAEVATELRGITELSACLLVAVTGHGKERLPIPSPFDHYFRKPVDIDSLLASLAELEVRRESPCWTTVAVA
jgi:two-component system, chemotaxis family, CheB/CheR fusion protein